MRNNLQDVLKIDCQDGILLSSINVTQELSPISDFSIYRSIENNVVINKSNNSRLKSVKYKCFIETTDEPDARLLQCGRVFKIHSILRLAEYIDDPNFKGNVETIRPPVFKSIFAYKNGREVQYNTNGNIITLLKNADRIIYKPTFDMILKDFICKYNNNKSKWSFVFEEV